PPARCVSQVSAPFTTARYFPSAPGTTPNAAQHSVVVLMLLRLNGVSPQPPSALTLRASQSRPLETRSAECGVRSEGSCFFSTTASAQTAAAVESALLESSPAQWPSDVRAARSSLRVSSSAC